MLCGDVDLQQFPLMASVGRAASGSHLLFTQNCCELATFAICPGKGQRARRQRHPSNQIASPHMHRSTRGALIRYGPCCGAAKTPLEVQFKRNDRQEPHDGKTK